MYEGERLAEFRKHWNKAANEQQEVGRFRARVQDALQEIWGYYIEGSDTMRQRFALISGTPQLNWDQRKYSYSDLDETLRNKPTLYEIVERIQFVLWTFESENPDALTGVCARLKGVIDASPGIPVRLVYQKGTARLYPMGALLLDEAVIDDNLMWLENYPDAAKAFQGALRLYFQKDPKNSRNLLDNLRVAVEQMLKAVLKNQKSLEHQKEGFLQWLAAHDAHSQIRNMYHDLLFGKFAQYQNDAVKHNEDKYTPAEVEFMLYLTGTLLRFIQRASEATLADEAT